MADALDFLHRDEYVHCDIKPESYLIQEIEGRPQISLTNFVVARRPGNQPWCGTVPYLTPEMQFGAVAHASRDAWSLGATVISHILRLEARPAFSLKGLMEEVKAQSREDATVREEPVKEVKVKEVDCLRRWTVVVANSVEKLPRDNELLPLLRSLLQLKPEDRMTMAMVKGASYAAMSHEERKRCGPIWR